VGVLLMSIATRMLQFAEILALVACGVASCCACTRSWRVPIMLQLALALPCRQTQNCAFSTVM